MIQLHRKEILCCTAVLLLLGLSACTRNNGTTEEEEITDPTTTYSIVRSDSSNGIEIIGNEGSNPLKVREAIRNYVIPEQQFTARRAKLYSLLDRLEQCTHADSVDYSEVDSLNYLSIHYLENLLRDPKSVTSGIRHRMLHTGISPDKCLRVYSWNENISPKWESCINVYQYRKKDRTFEVAFHEESSLHDAGDFRSGKTDRIIHPYTAGDSSDLYLILFSGCQGKEHLFKGAGCVEICPDGIRFNTPVFNAKTPSISLHYPENGSASISYDSRKRSLQLRRIQPKQLLNDTLEYTYLYDGKHFTLTE